MDMKHVKYLALVLCIGNLSPVMAQTVRGTERSV